MTASFSSSVSKFFGPVGVAGLALVAACGSGDLQDASFATGSSTLATSADHMRVFAVHTDNGLVAVLDANGDVQQEIDVGSEPTRIARANDEVWVTLRGERGIAILKDDGTSLSLSETMSIGAEPYGIVASENGKRVFVAASMQGLVHEVDTSSRSVLRSWKVDGEPRWVALHPSGNFLFVASGFGARLTQIDLRTGESTALSLPQTQRSSEIGEVELTPRITGDIAVSPDGTTLVVPVVYADTVTPVDDPTPEEPPSNGYASVGDGVSRFTPSIVEIPVSGGDGADDRAALALFLTTTAELNNFNTLRSFPSSVAVSPDSAVYYATLEGSDVVVALGRYEFAGNKDNNDIELTMDFADTGGRNAFTSAESGGFVRRPRSVIASEAGPNGVAFLGDGSQATIFSTLDLSFSRFQTEDVLLTVKDQGLDGFENPGSHLPRLGAKLSRSVLPADVQAGRRLFFSATSPQMASSGAGVSCSTCHSDGRNDGLTWTFKSGVRQTPSLAGKVSLTEPMTWTSEVPTIADEARITSQGRMGGHGISQHDLDALQAYVDWSRPVDNPARGRTDALVLEGKAIFERADVGCASCHSGDQYTDNKLHPLFGLQRVNTPPLVGVGATAPYLHDGSAATLRDVLAVSRNGAMGDTSGLSEHELDALEAYLRSL